MSSASETAWWLDEFRAVRRTVEDARERRRGSRAPAAGTDEGPPGASPIRGMGPRSSVVIASRTLTGRFDEERRRRLPASTGGGAGKQSRTWPAFGAARTPSVGGGAAAGGVLHRARQVAAGYQPAVVKVVSYAHGVARATATGQYVQRDGAALETHDSRMLVDRDAVANEMKAWSAGFARRAESRDVVTVRMTLAGVRDTPEGRDLYQRAASAGLEGHRFALRIDGQASGALEARVAVVMAGAGKERFRVREHRVGAGEGAFTQRRLDPLSEAAVKARIGVATGLPEHAISLAPGRADHGHDGVGRQLERLVATAPAQDDRGRVATSSADARTLAREWTPALRSQSVRDTMHLVLSARAGTDVAALTAAARGFLHDRFADHKFLFGVHTDREAEGHVHVHAVVAVRSEAGRKIHPGRETFREWREAYAAHAQAQGLRIVATTARERASSQSYGTRDKAIVELAERPRPVRHERDRAYAQRSTSQALIERARARMATASANPIRIPRSAADRADTARSLAAWKQVAEELPHNAVVTSLAGRLALADVLGGIVETIAQRTDHLTREHHGMAITAEQMAKDLRLMNEAVTRTGDLLDGPTKQRFDEASARYLDTLSNRVELQRMQERGAAELTRSEVEALVGPNADRLLERARDIATKEVAEAVAARQIADRASENEWRQEGRGTRDEELRRELTADRAAARASSDAAGRETREAAAAVEAARTLSEQPGAPLSVGLSQTDALAQLKREQEGLLRELDAERPHGLKGQRIT